MEQKLFHVCFARQTGDAAEQEVKDMIDDVIFQALSFEGLRAIIQPGDRVVLKVNVADPYMGERGEKGRGIITDPRLVRYVADLARQIIGFGDGASTWNRKKSRNHLAVLQMILDSMLQS